MFDILNSWGGVVCRGPAPRPDLHVRTPRRDAALRPDPALFDPDRVRATLEDLYRINLDTSVGRIAQLISELAQVIPSVAQAFHGGFITR